jgi:hypothetical protein
MSESSHQAGQLAESLERLRRLSDERQADLEQQQHTAGPPDDAAQRRAEALDVRDDALGHRAETADRRDETQERREAMLNDRKTTLDQREQLLDRRESEDRHAADRPATGRG